MKRWLIIALVLATIVALTGCKRPAPAATATGPFPGKIAVVTNDVSQNEEEFRSAEHLVRKYGADKITHVTWPANFMAEQEQMITILQRIAADTDVRALVINQAVPNTNAAVDRLKETRPDIWIVYVNPQENPVDVSRRANLILRTDDFAMGPAIARQAHEQGAKVFVHYSFPRHMAQVFIAGRRDRIRDEALRLGLEFHDATAPDPTGDAGVTGTQQYILEDVPRQVARFGKDTAFFGTNCAMQIPMIRAIVDHGAIYPQPCCPSPFHGFPSALGIPTTPDIPPVVEATRRAIAAAGMTGRLSTWPIPAGMMFTVAGAEYAIKVLNGQVPRDIINEAVLIEVANDYVRALLGETVSMGVQSYVEAGTTYQNTKLVLVGYLTY